MRGIKNIFIIIMALIFVMSMNPNIIYAQNTSKEVTKIIDELQYPNKVWTIEFSGDLDRNTVNKDNIYVEDDKGNIKKDIDLEVISGTKVKVTPGTEYAQDKTYFLCISSGVKSNQGKSISKNYRMQFKTNKVDSNFFKIRTVEPKSENIVNVYFTQPININSELPMNFDIYRDGKLYVNGGFDTINAKCISGINNGISIYLKEDEFSSKHTYEIKVSGNMTSSYGVKLKDGKGDSIEFKGNDDANTLIDIKRVLPINDYTIKVEYNMAVDKKSSTYKENYKLIDDRDVPRSIDNVYIENEGEEAGKAVYIKLIGKLDNSRRYKLLIENVEDVYEANTIEDVVYPFKASEVEANKLEILNATAVDKGTVEVYFNKKLEGKYAAESSLYNIIGSSIKEVYFNSIENPYRVVLFLNKNELLESNKDYKLIVSPQVSPDYSKVDYESVQYKFKGNSDQYYLPNISDAKFIGKDIVLVKFSRIVSQKSANNIKDNYYLEYEKRGETRKVYAKSLVWYDNQSLILKFDDLDTEESYKIKYNSLMDYSGQYLNTNSNNVSVD